jgi:hypothetical protein
MASIQTFLERIANNYSSEKCAPLEGAEEGTDRWAIEHNWVSGTSLGLDLTDGKGSRALIIAYTNTTGRDSKKKVDRFCAIRLESAAVGSLSSRAKSLIFL